MLEGAKLKDGDTVFNYKDLERSQLVDEADQRFFKGQQEEMDSLKEMATGSRIIRSRDLDKLKETNSKAYNSIVREEPIQTGDVFDEVNYSKINKEEYNKMKDLQKVKEQLKKKVFLEDGDMSSFTNNPKTKHNILSEKYTGVHKVRNYKLPYGTRSVYFKGG